MTSSMDITKEFKAAIKAFTPIVGKLKDNDLRGVKKVLFQTGLSIRLTGSKSGKFNGLVLPVAA